MDEHDAALVAADARVLPARQEPHEVGELAGDLGAGVAAAGDEEGQQAAPLLWVGLDVGQLEHLEDVVLERGSSRRKVFSLNACSARPGVELEVLRGAEREHEVVVLELVARAVEVAARDHLARLEVDLLDLADVDTRRARRCAAPG